MQGTLAHQEEPIQVLDPSLVPSVQALTQLAPANQELVLGLIGQLAEREGISISGTVAPGLQTPAEGINLWLTYLKTRNYSPHTLTLYEASVRSHLTLDPSPTRLSIEQRLAEILEGGSPQKASTLRKALNSFFGYLSEVGLWSFNPTAHIKSWRIPRRERSIPSEADVLKLLRAKCHRKSDTQKFRLFVFLLLDTGLRISEAASIRKCDINFTRSEIRVVGKGNKERFVPVSQVVCQAIERNLANFNHRPSPYLFPGGGATGYRDIRSFERTMRKACNNLEIAPISPHQLRHFFATHTLKAGAKLEVISRILGHSSVGITADIYRHVDREEMHAEHQSSTPLKALLGFPGEGLRCP